MKKATIVLINENERQLSSMSEFLKGSNFQVTEAKNLLLFEQKKNNCRANLVIIAVEPSIVTILELFQHLLNNKSLSEAFVVMLSQQKQDEIQVMALNSGADDFLVQPIAQRVLLKRINALLKRKKPMVIATNLAFHIDYERFLIVKGKQEIYLSKKEFQLLSLLYSKPERIFTREEIRKILWVNFDQVQIRTIDVHIRKIREKIGENSIETIQGKGYKLTAA